MEEILAMILVSCWYERGFTCRELPTALSVYILLLYTQNTLRTILFVIQRLNCGVTLSFSLYLKSGVILTGGQRTNAQTFRKLGFRPLLKCSFHGIHKNWRDMKRKKSIICIFTYNLIYFALHRCLQHPYATKKAMHYGFSKNSRFYNPKNFGRHCRKRFDAIVQSVGRTEIPLCKKNHVLAGERVRLRLLEFSAYEIAEFVSGKESLSRRPWKAWKGKPWEKTK